MSFPVYFVESSMRHIFLAFSSCLLKLKIYFYIFLSYWNVFELLDKKIVPAAVSTCLLLHLYALQSFICFPLAALKQTLSLAFLPSMNLSLDRCFRAETRDYLDAVFSYSVSPSQFLPVHIV